MKPNDRATDLKGKAKENLGRAVGDDEMRAEGKADQGRAKLSQAADKVKNVADDVGESVASVLGRDKR